MGHLVDLEQAFQDVASVLDLLLAVDAGILEGLLSAEAVLLHGVLSSKECQTDYSTGNEGDPDLDGDLGQPELLLVCMFSATEPDTSDYATDPDTEDDDPERDHAATVRHACPPQASPHGLPGRGQRGADHQPSVGEKVRCPGCAHELSWEATVRGGPALLDGDIWTASAFDLRSAEVDLELRCDDDCGWSKTISAGEWEAR